MQPEPKFKEGERVKYLLWPTRGKASYGEVKYAHSQSESQELLYSVYDDNGDLKFVYEHEMEKLDA